MKGKTRSLLAASLLAALSLSCSRADWSAVPIDGGGFISGMAISSDGTGVYIRTDVGGAYRWLAASGTWQPLTDGLPNDTANTGPGLGIGSVAVPPDNANSLYIASGTWDWSSPSGIYVTSDATVAAPVWTSVDSTVRVYGNGPIRSYGERLAVDPNNTTVVYYGTNNISGGGTGLKKYVFEYGSWWTSSILNQPPALGDADCGITFVACDKGGGSWSDGYRTVTKTIYIGVYSATTGSGGVYVTRDGAQTWTLIGGIVVDRPAHGAVAGDGTLYVTYDAGVVKMARGGTAFASVTPTAGQGYVALAVDPNSAATVMVASNSATNVIYRSANAGSSWTAVSRTAHPTEPDGTPSVTTNGSLDNISFLTVNPANSSEVWTGDFLGVQRSQNIGTSPSDWYCLQKNIEEIVPMALKSAPTGAPLLSSDADADGFAHGDVGSRPVVRFDTPELDFNGGSTTSTDFCEATYSGDTVLARAFDNFASPIGGTGAVSLDDGDSWLRFGQIARHVIYNNSSTTGWEEWDVAAYLKQQKALGNNSVTLAIACDEDIDVSSYDSITFSSKEAGSNTPQLVMNGSTTLTPTDDASLFQYYPTTPNNGTTLQVSFQQNNPGANRRAFLKFDLSGVSTVTSATLRLYRHTSMYNHYFPTGVYAVAPSAWAEATVTWNTQPALLCGTQPQYHPTVPGGFHGGRVALAANDPANIVWADENGHVNYSKDRGVTWTPGTLGGSSLVISGIPKFSQQKNPLTSDRVAANTFYLFADNVAGGTVYRSTDGGATWASLATLADAYAPKPAFKLSGVPNASGRFWVLTQVFNSPGAFKYWNGSALANVSGITNVIDFSFGAPAPGRTNPMAYVRKGDGTYWSSPDASAGGTFTWTQVSASVVNIGANIMEGDRQNYGRLYIGSPGRGILYAGGSTVRTFYCQDSYVQNGTYAALNQAGATATTVDVKNDASPYQREGYFQFDFTSYSGTVSAASITLTPLSAGMAGIQNQVSLVASNQWTETGVTWNTKPASSTVLATYTVTAGTPVVIPVTAQVAAALAADKRLSIRVACTSAANTGNLVSYGSSENPTLSVQPVLNITP